MKVLLVGGGGREHALGWKITQSPLVHELISLPGNPGLAGLGSTVEGIDATDVGAVAHMAEAQQVDLVVVGPEDPLAAGLVDALAGRGIAAFGPSKAAARLEGSKQFAKAIMDRAGVATAAWQAFSERDSALTYLAGMPGPFVVKADGLAAGKGVLVTEDRSAAGAWVDRCLNGDFGAAGHTVVIEEFLDGPELSVFAICDGTNALPLVPARDYKRLADGDAGPNTGGMGCYSPVDGLPDGIVEHTMTQVIDPVLQTMAADGNPYVGFIYAGLVLTADGPKVLEFNCRLGDPETQVVLPLMEDDLMELLLASLDGSLSIRTVTWFEGAAVNVVLAADGYPEAPRKGDPISGINAAAADEGVLVFHAGTAIDDGRIITAGGRVLNIVGTGPNTETARQRAYAAAAKVTWAGRQFRRDIASAK
ncbi:MAG: phosphoribosylamine--glycine ligase [Acidimicrobiia bacterium]|nr:phosphoribosylamine--glycine ligase [Acidimicrobiia bacterium]